jgi:FKBP12-rapamycin complex-associated protein
MPNTGSSNLLKKAPLETGSSSVGVVGEGQNLPNEGLNKKALAVINRVRDKLTGRDFEAHLTLDVPEQVDLLIKQATSHENLCQCYIGWCPFW